MVSVSYVSGLHLHLVLHIPSQVAEATGPGETQTSFSPATHQLLLGYPEAFPGKRGYTISSESWVYPRVFY